jgi:hypothetical protein
VAVEAGWRRRLAGWFSLTDPERTGGRGRDRKIGDRGPTAGRTSRFLGVVTP